MTREDVQRVQRVARERGYRGQLHSVRYSPDGRRIALSLFGATAVVRTDGQDFRVIPGTLNGWGGNASALTLLVNQHGVVTLTSNALSGGSQPRELEKSFKLPLATDPRGSYFGYARFDGMLILRRSNGTLLRKRKPKLRMSVVGARSADGRILLPTSAY